jgi:hypothetical protein
MVDEFARGWLEDRLCGAYLDIYEAERDFECYNS